MGERDARTQGAADMGHIWATEDEAACRPARFGGTSLILIRALQPDAPRVPRQDPPPPRVYVLAALLGFFGPVTLGGEAAVP